MLVEPDRIGVVGGPSPSICTVVSSWPATTWALVTTMPSPAIQPDPWTPRPQAVPSTLTTLCRRAHVGIAGDRRVGRAYVGRGAVDARQGSKRASALRRARRAAGGLSSRRITERWIGSRRSRAPGVWSATAPSDPDEDEAKRSHRTLRPPRRAARGARRAAAQVKAEHSSPEAQTTDHQRADEREERRVGRPRALLEEKRAEPRAQNAPAAKPTSDSAPTISPCR